MQEDKDTGFDTEKRDREVETLILKLKVDDLKTYSKVSFVKNFIH